MKTHLYALFILTLVLPDFVRGQGCSVSVSVNQIDACGQVALTATGVGLQPISYQWCNGTTGATQNLQLSCGPYTCAVTVTCGDGTTATAAAALTVKDSEPPLAKCAPGNGYVLDANCAFAVTPAIIDAGSTDNCQIQSIEVTPDVVYGCGVFPITMTVTDRCGNKGICQTSIQTGESDPPVMTCPPDVTVSGELLGGQFCAALAIVGVPTVFDNCTQPVTLTNDHTQGANASGAYPQGATTVTWTAIDACGNQATCSVSVVVQDCVAQPKDTCCAYALHLFNGYADGRIKKVKVTGLCDTEICCADPDDWAQSPTFPYSVEFFPADGSGFPLGTVSDPPEPTDVIDNDFEIWLKKTSGDHQLQVDWYDFSDNLVCTHLIQIACDGNFQEEEDWPAFTSTTVVQDPNLFAFCVREPEEDDETACDPEERDFESTDCNITKSIICNTPNYQINLATSITGTNYYWSVKKDETPTPTPPTITVGTNGTASFSVPSDGSKSGRYIVSLTVSTPTTNSTTTNCSSEIEVYIPKIVAAFTYKLVPCGLSVEMTPDIGNFKPYVQSIDWSCSNQGQTGFPTSSPGPNFPSITYAFTGEAIYYVTMVITDIYNCTHTVTQAVNNSRICNPNFEVEYDFCQTDCNGQSTISRLVTFKNTSTGGGCPPNYVWDFGDGNTESNNAASVPHLYTNITCPGGNVTPFYVKLTMDDAQALPVSAQQCVLPIATQKSVEITPCQASFTYVACPDGTVIFTSNVPGEWSFPGSDSIVERGSELKDARGLRKKVKVKYPDGNYSVTFNGYCDNGGRCQVTIYEIHVEIICCRKHSRKHDVERFTENGRRYKMKYRFVQNQYIGDLSFTNPLNGNSYLLSVHSLKAQTRLKRRNSKFYNFWKPTYDGTLTASFTGDVYTADDNCNCNVVKMLSDNNGPHSLRTKVTAKKTQLGKYHSRENSVQSTHTVSVGAQSFTFNFLLGKECTKFKAWLDSNF